VTSKVLKRHLRTWKCHLPLVRTGKVRAVASRALRVGPALVGAYEPHGNPRVKPGEGKAPGKNQIAHSGRAVFQRGNVSGTQPRLRFSRNTMPRGPSLVALRWPRGWGRMPKSN